MISALGLPVALPITASGVILLAGSSMKALQVHVFNSNRLPLCAAPVLPGIIPLLFASIGPAAVAPHRASSAEPNQTGLCSIGTGEVGVNSP